MLVAYECCKIMMKKSGQIAKETWCGKLGLRGEGRRKQTPATPAALLADVSSSPSRRAEDALGSRGQLVLLPMANAMSPQTLETEAIPVHPVCRAVLGMLLVSDLWSALCTCMSMCTRVRKPKGDLPC